MSASMLLSRTLLPLAAFLALCSILYTLPEHGEPPPGHMLHDRTCITGGWKFALIFTHALNFVLIPVAMYVFHHLLCALHFPPSSVFSSQLGLAFVMVAVAAEIGWHVTQCWYYVNQFTMLNFTFYFFLLASLALWSGALVPVSSARHHFLDIAFVALLSVASVLYAVGAQSHNTLYKLPIYVALTLILLVISLRAYAMLRDWRVVAFPVFSVVVNLFFVALLQRYGGDPYVNPRVASNAFYHIAHDLLGTEAGVLVLTALMHYKARRLSP
ncbi:unnamed protein product [Agarophyton chilense]